MKITCTGCGGTNPSCDTCGGSGEMEACFYDAALLQQETMLGKIDAMVDKVDIILDKCELIVESLEP